MYGMMMNDTIIYDTGLILTGNFCCFFFFFALFICVECVRSHEACSSSSQVDMHIIVILVV